MKKLVGNRSYEGDQSFAGEANFWAFLKGYDAVTHNSLRREGITVAELLQMTIWDVIDLWQMGPRRAVKLLAVLTKFKFQPVWQEQILAAPGNQELFEELKKHLGVGDNNEEG